MACSRGDRTMSETNEPPKKRGRPKGKPLSPAERAQRRNAPRRHGLYATTAAGQTLPPCKRKACPAEASDRGGFDRCEVRRAVQSRGGALEGCIVALVADSAVLAAYTKALTTGDLAELGQLEAHTLAKLATLRDQELDKIHDEGGLAIDQSVFDGEGEETGSRKVENPRAKPFLALNQQVGSTAKDNAITPSSRAEKGLNEGLTDAARRAWVDKMRLGVEAE